MTEIQIRTAILDALDASYVTMDSLTCENFLSGSQDYLIDELDMDSLSIMEFCISLEINGIITIVPEDLVALKSLNQLVEIIAKKNK